MNDNHEVGFVTSIRNYLLHLEGLPSARVNDLIVSERGCQAIIQSLDGEKIQALLVSEVKAHPQETFRKKNQGINLPVGKELFGRIIDPLGKAVDGKKPLETKEKIRLAFDVVALGINYREEISEQLETGITTVDTLVPIGKGQRELIFGDPRSGKTTFLIDTIKKQHDSGTICIYALIGKSEGEVKEIYTELEENEALDSTILVTAGVRDGAPVIAMAANSAFGIADHFRSTGNEVLLVLDDLGTHAKYLREVSLLSQTLPGREAYPGDIFYQHAHLLERAGNFSDKAGSGTITLLPVIEADLENFSTLIPTNLMASTDGHLLFTASLRAQGYYPSVNVDGSVTRVGRKTQHPLLRQLAERIRPVLAEYQEIKSYGIFGAELGEKTQESIRRGKIALQLLEQEPNQNIDIKVQILLLSLLFSKFLANRDVNFVAENKKKILDALNGEEFRKLLDDKDDQGFDALIKKLDTKNATLEKACRGKEQGMRNPRQGIGT